MRHSDKMIREDVITEALRVMNDALDGAEPNDQVLAMFKAVKGIRAPEPLSLPISKVTDYMAWVQREARSAWESRASAYTAGRPIGPRFSVTAGVDTPIGRLALTTWRREWVGSIKGERIAWAGEYTLDGEPITVAEIRAAGLAQRPTTRNRKKK